MPLANLQLVVLDDVQRALNSASIRKEPDFAFLEIAHDGNLSLDAAVAPKGLEVLEKAVSVARESNPVSVYEYLRLLGT